MRHSNNNPAEFVDLLILKPLTLALPMHKLIMMSNRIRTQENIPLVCASPHPGSVVSPRNPTATMSFDILGPTW
jgi:hypothetical protein